MNPTITVRLSLDCVKKIIFSKSKNDNKLGLLFIRIISDLSKESRV